MMPKNTGTTVETIRSSGQSVSHGIAQDADKFDWPAAVDALHSV